MAPEYSMSAWDKRMQSIFLRSDSISLQWEQSRGLEGVEVAPASKRMRELGRVRSTAFGGICVIIGGGGLRSLEVGLGLSRVRVERG